MLELDVRANVLRAVRAEQRTSSRWDARITACISSTFGIPRRLSPFSGHRGVSYVRFLPTGDELASASTDSTMCVWDVRGSVIDAARKAATPSRPKVLEGTSTRRISWGSASRETHACGSETNEVFVPQIVQPTARQVQLRRARGGDVPWRGPRRRSGNGRGSDGSSAATAAAAGEGPPRARPEPPGLEAAAVLPWRSSLSARVGAGSSRCCSPRTATGSSRCCSWWRDETNEPAKAMIELNPNRATRDVRRASAFV